MSQNKFLKGAAILGIAGIIVKVMGVFFRIPLTNWVGADGISYYSSVYPIYTFFLILSTAGIPVAVSRMVSERIAVSNYGGAHKVFHTALWFLSLLGFVTFAIVYFGAGFIESHVLKNEGTMMALQAIAPALFIVPVMSAYRGYFQGRQNMNPTAISQLAEQFFRVVVGLALAYYLIPSGYEAVSAGATFGCTAGAVAGLAVVVIIYLLNLPAIQTRIRRNRSKAHPDHCDPDHHRGVDHAADVLYRQRSCDAQTAGNRLVVGGIQTSVGAFGRLLQFSDRHAAGADTGDRHEPGSGDCGRI